jgi:hypothetical protein
MDGGGVGVCLLERNKWGDCYTIVAIVVVQVDSFDE